MTSESVRISVSYSVEEDKWPNMTILPKVAKNK
jgi:hypothetical protein